MPHPWVVGAGCGSTGGSVFVGSTNEGGANTTAVLEMGAAEVGPVLAADATAAPTGSRVAAGLTF